MARGPVFLERQSYRLRRMLDAIRLLPFLGILLWMVPLMWPLPEGGVEGSTGAMPMSVALQYLFGVWIGLVLLGWLLWRRTADKLSATAALRPDDPG
ncbi:MAG: hypothetical protein ABJL67_16605 [Sulfitobacter sp.]